MPPCPVCGAPTQTDWIDIHALIDPRSEWVPGQLWCTVNEDHDVTSLDAQDWAVETGGALPQSSGRRRPLDRDAEQVR